MSQTTRDKHIKFNLLTNNMELIDDKLIWKKCDQHKYYKILCINYIKKLFEFIKNKNYMFYLEYDENAFDIINKYYNADMINIQEFEKTKTLKHYTSFPFYNENKNIYDVDDTNFGFTIIDYDESETISGCGKCNTKYGGNIWFKGLVYNTGLDDDNPIPYEGYIKTYLFFRCECDKDNDEIIYQNNNGNFDDIPCVEIVCSPLNNKHNLCMLKNCILFNLKYTKII